MSNMPFPSGYLPVFFFLIFNILIMMYLSMDLFGFIVLKVHWASWSQVYVFYHTWEVLTIIKNIYIWHSDDTSVRHFGIASLVPEPIIFIQSIVSLFRLYIYIFSSSRTNFSVISFLCHFHSVSEPFKYFTLIIVVFNSRIFFISSLNLLSYCLYS